MKKLLLLSLISILFQSQCYAQILPETTVTGYNAPDVKWKYVDSRAIKVIFPAGNEQEAIRLANVINFIYDSLTVSIGSKRKHLDMLLQTNQVISNGYVALAPYRSELYGVPIQNTNWLGSVKWLDVLAFHEYRHALQFSNSRRGLTGFFSIVGGQSLWSFAQALSVPNWFMEGDAVQTETLFSGAGRGRTPYYFQEQRALLFNDVDYSYMKARNGSFKSLVPDHYRLGYAMLHQVRLEHGPDAWKKIYRDASGYKGVFYPFSKAMKRHTGYGSQETYRRTYDSLEANWQKELKNINLIANERLSDLPKKVVADYEWPHQLDDGSIVFRKQSYNRTAELVKLKDGKEESLVVMGFPVTESYLSVNDNVAAWTEYATDPRWANRNYSDIVTYNLATKQKIKVTSKTRLYSPFFSAKHNQIVAVKIDESLKISIVFIDPVNGTQVGSLPNPDNDFISYPRWTRDGESIVYVAKKESMVTIVKYDLATKTSTELTPLSANVIEAISLGKETVYFTASYSGINNVYAVNLNGDKLVRQITSVKVGANNPNISSDEKTLATIEVSPMGNSIYKQGVNLNNAATVQVVEPEFQTKWRIPTNSTERKIYNRIPNNNFEVKNYTGLIRGPKLHSWGFTGNQQQASVSLHVNNILNDFGASVTAGRNLNENANFLTGTIDYSRFYLPIRLIGSINEREILQPTNLEKTGVQDTITTKYTEAIYGGGLSLPLSWKLGIYTTSLKAYGNAAFIKTYNYEIDEVDNDDETELSIAEAGISFSNIRGRAKQNILPRFGQEIDAYYGKSLTGTSADKFSGEAAFYFPGIGRNHGFKLTAAYKQEQLSNDYRFFDTFKHARGYEPIQGDKETVLSVNYSFPLAYPDAGFAGLVYFKRLRANLFADFSQVKRDALNKTFDQNSAGIELTFDVVSLNVLPISVGYRYSYLMNDNYYDRDQSTRLEVFFAGTF